MDLRAHVLGLVVIALAIANAPARAQDYPPGLVNVGVTERLGNRVPLDLGFRDHEGHRVRLRDFVNGERPVVLNLVYHTCPSACGLVLDATTTVLSRQEWSVGEEITVITVSIDPRDTPEIAAARRARTLRRYDREGAERGWHFLVAESSMTTRELVASYGANPNAQRLASALGFRYEWKPREQEYAHSAATFFLTPDGRVARYLYGLEYNPNDVRMSLLEASEVRSVSTVERIMLYCYRYDATRGEYVVIAENVMKIGGGVIMLSLLAFLAFYWRRELKRKDRGPGTPKARAASVRS